MPRLNCGHGAGCRTDARSGTHPALTKKFVNCEEVNIRPNSQQVNDLKALFTDDKMALERKGIEVEQTDLTGVFLFTSNHVPNFLKGLDRRLYVIKVSHDSHASGPNAEQFGNLVERVQAALEDDQQVAALYTYLKSGLISPGFNPNSLNTATQTHHKQQVQGRKSTMLHSCFSLFLT